MKTKSKRKTDLRQLKARLVERGYTIRAFAKEGGYSAATVYAALSGRRAGRQSQIILRHIERL